MYAVIMCGGKQHKVSEGDTIHVELLQAEPGTSIQFDKVMLVSDGTNTHIGTPYLSAARVSAEVLGEVKGEKIKIVKFRRRKHYQKTTGHRQKYTSLKITGVAAG